MLRKTLLLLIVVLFVDGCSKDEKIDLPTVKIFDGAVTTAYTTANITARVTEEGGAPVKLRGVVYGRSDEELDTVYCGIGSVAFSASLNGLAPNTTYVYEVFAINNGGVGLSGKDSFTTKDYSVPSVNTMAVFNEGATIAYCRGEVTNDGGSAVIESLHSSHERPPGRHNLLCTCLCH